MPMPEAGCKPSVHGLAPLKAYMPHHLLETQREFREPIEGITPGRPPGLICGSSGRLRVGYANSLKGLKTLSPGRLKSLSFPVAIVSPWRRAVAAM